VDTYVGIIVFVSIEVLMNSQRSELVMLQALDRVIDCIDTHFREFYDAFKSRDATIDYEERGAIADLKGHMQAVRETATAPTVPTAPTAAVYNSPSFMLDIKKQREVTLFVNKEPAILFHLPPFRSEMIERLLKYEERAHSIIVVHTKH
jgi:hypothetical protein